MAVGERLALYIWDGKEGVWLYDKWSGEWFAVKELVVDMLQKGISSVKEFVETYKQFDRVDIEELAKKGAIEYLAIVDLERKMLTYIEWFERDMDEAVLEYVRSVMSVAEYVEKIKVYNNVWRLVEVKEVKGEKVAIYENQNGAVRAFFANEARDRALLRRRIIQGVGPVFLLYVARQYKKEKGA